MNTVSNTIDELKNEVLADFKTISDEANGDLQQLKNKQKELYDDINSKATNFDNKIVELEETINQKNADIDIIKEKYVKEIESIKKAYEDQISELSENANQGFDKLKSDIEKKDKKISELIGLIGNKANIGEYKTNADKAHSERVHWQVATVVIFAAAFGLMGLVTFYTKSYSVVTLARYIVSIILLGMSGYTGKQASNSRKDEAYYRKQQLELSSMDVYLDDMPDNIKQEIKQNLSNKIFGQAGATYKSKYDDSNNETLDKVVKIIESMSNIINKK